MKKFRRVSWGILLIAAGVLFGLNALNITNINIFFEGWWTLLIIIPSVTGLFSERDKTGCFIGLAMGVLLLLCCRGILSFSLLWKLLAPAFIVILGCKLVFSGLFGNKASDMIVSIRKNGGEPKVGYAVFSGCDVNFDAEVFEGAELTATFGALKCDLRNAVIEKDCAIQVWAIFGGIDILVPENVNVKFGTNCLFAGTSNKTGHRRNVPTVYIGGVCMFGGVEVK